MPGVGNNFNVNPWAVAGLGGSQTAVPASWSGSANAAALTQTFSAVDQLSQTIGLPTVPTGAAPVTAPFPNSPLQTAPNGVNYGFQGVGLGGMASQVWNTGNLTISGAARDISQTIYQQFANGGMADGGQSILAWAKQLQMNAALRKNQQGGSAGVPASGGSPIGNGITSVGGQSVVDWAKGLQAKAALRKAQQQASGTDDNSSSNTGASTSDSGTNTNTTATNQSKSKVTADEVKKMFPASAASNIDKYLPQVLNALAEQGIDDPQMVRYALATIKVESGNFAPISEYGKPGKYNGYYGRGFIQLTHKSNYETYGKKLGVDLVGNPEKANDPGTAARVLASFLKQNESRIRKGLNANNLGAARKVVNGGTNGLRVFSEAYNTAGSFAA